MQKLPVPRMWICLANVFSFAGLLYSGTIAYQKFTTGICAFGASCPYLFGIPVCYFGFLGFLTLSISLSSIFWVEEKKAKSVYGFLYWFTLGGTLFALYFLIYELFVLPIPPGTHFISLGYPSCLYGFLAFGAAFLSVRKILLVWSDVPEAESE